MEYFTAVIAAALSFSALDDDRVGMDMPDADVARVEVDAPAQYFNFNNAGYTLLWQGKYDQASSSSRALCMPGSTFSEDATPEAAARALALRTATTAHKQAMPRASACHISMWRHDASGGHVVNMSLRPVTGPESLYVY
jgi:hypothetical protein